jgi:type I restriction enzyme M protein
MDDRDTKGDVYEYKLSKIASAGQNGQFRTPPHIIQLMVALTAPQPREVVCDPASGTCGFLVATAEYLQEHNAGLFDTPGERYFQPQRSSESSYPSHGSFLTYVQAHSFS